MFIRRAAAILLVDVQIALESGQWTPTRSADPHAAMARLEDALMLRAEGGEDAVGDAVDALHLILGEAMSAGEAIVPGYEHLVLGDLTTDLFVDDAAPAAANDDEPARLAA